MRHRHLTVLLLALVAACSGPPSIDPSDSEPSGVPPAAGTSSSAPPAAGDHEAARYEELRHWSGTFHTAPNPVPAGDPGTLLRLESVAADAGKRVYRSMYLSTLVDGATQLTVTGTIWVPAGTPPPGGFPIVAWGPGSNPHGLGIFGDGCAFSHRPIHPETDHQDHFAQLMADGFVVATTDYPGHGTQEPYLYTVGEAATHALIDAARAARDLLGPAASDRVIIAGFSLGGVAAHQSLLYLEPYDQGLDIRGIVSIEGIGDLTASAETTDPEAVGVQETMFTAYAWPLAYPELRAEEVLTAEGMRLLGMLHENGCVWFSEYDSARVLDATIGNWMDVPSWAARIQAQTVTHAPYPTFYVVAEENPMQDHLLTVAERLCQTTDHVTAQVYPGTDHDSVIGAAYDEWISWMQERVTSEEPFDGCAF